MHLCEKNICTLVIPFARLFIVLVIPLKNCVENSVLSLFRLVVLSRKCSHISTLYWIYLQAWRGWHVRGRWQGRIGVSHSVLHISKSQNWCYLKPLTSILCNGQWCFLWLKYCILLLVDWYEFFFHPFLALIIIYNYPYLLAKFIRLVFMLFVHLRRLLLVWVAQVITASWFSGLDMSHYNILNCFFSF